MVTLSDILYLGSNFMSVLMMCLCVHCTAGSLPSVQKYANFVVSPIKEVHLQQQCKFCCGISVQYNLQLGI